MHPRPARYSLRTLLIVSTFAPAVLAAAYFSLTDWSWFDLWLLLPLAAALAAGICAVVRWKWYGLIPAALLALLAYTAAPYARLFLQDLSEPINWRLREGVLIWLLGSSATLIALTSIWAGYSQARWYWRAAAMGACLAILASIDATEPILFCLATMPPIAAGSWLIRYTQYRGKPATTLVQEQIHPRDRRRWSVQDTLLLLVIIGLFAAGLWPLMSGDLHFSSGRFAISSISYIAICLATASAGLARNRMSRVLLSLVALVLFVIGLVVHRHFNCDTLGLLYYFDMPRAPLRLVVTLGVAAAAMTALLLLLARLYAVATESSRSLYRRWAGGMLAMIVLVLALPLAIVYPRMLPPATNVTALPPSTTFDRLQVVERQCHSMRAPDFNASLVVKGTKEVLAEPGNVWYQPGEFRDSELQYHVSRDSIGYLPSLLEIETAQAEQAGRPSECLELAILQWRLGRVLRHGGVFADWEQGYRSESYGCGTVSDAVDKLSLEECRLALGEVRLSLADRPDTETVLAYHAYWGRACFGWRQALYDSTRWLAGEKMDSISGRVDKPQFEILNKLGLARLRLIEARLALEIFRRKHGEWPAELKSLVPEYLEDVPADPFATSSLIYRRKNDGFLLYSVGPDGKDDGCRTGNNESVIKRGGYDVDWELDHRIQLETWPRKQ